MEKWVQGKLGTILKFCLNYHIQITWLFLFLSLIVIILSDCCTRQKKLTTIADVVILFYLLHKMWDCGNLAVIQQLILFYSLLG